MAIPQGAALKKGYNQWPNGIVPYTLSSSFSKFFIYNYVKSLDQMLDVLNILLKYVSSI